MRLIEFNRPDCSKIYISAGQIVAVVPDPNTGEVTLRLIGGIQVVRESLEEVFKKLAGA